MNRRSFLSTLAALPGLRWLKPQSGIVPMSYVGSTQLHGIELDVWVPDAIRHQLRYQLTPQEPAWPVAEMFIVDTIRTVEGLDHGLTVGDYVEWSRTLQRWTPPPFPCPFTN